MNITDDRLAQIAIQAASAQAWESRQMAADLLAFRIANKIAGSRKSTNLPPVEPSASKGQSES